MGRKELIFSVEISETKGSFRKLCRAVGQKTSQNLVIELMEQIRKIFVGID